MTLYLSGHGSGGIRLPKPQFSVLLYAMWFRAEGVRQFIGGAVSCRGTEIIVCLSHVCFGLLLTRRKDFVR